MLTTFTAATDFGGTATPKGQGVNKRLASWHLANNGITPAVISFQDSDTSVEQFQVCLPANASASQAYPSPLYTKGGWKVALTTAGTFSRGLVDLI